MGFHAAAKCSVLCALLVGAGCNASSSKRTPSTKNISENRLQSALDALPSDLGLLLIVNRAQLRESNQQLLEWIEAYAFEGRVGDGSCEAEIYQASTWGLIAAPEPLSTEGFLFAFGLSAEPECAKEAFAEGDDSTDDGVLRRYAPGLYRGASTSELMKSWARGQKPSKLRSLVRGDSQASWQFAVADLDRLLPALTPGHAPKGHAPSLVLTGDGGETVNLRAALTFSNPEDLEKAEEHFTSSITSLFEAAAYGDFARAWSESFKLSRAGSALVLSWQVEESGLRDFIERFALYPSQRVQPGTARAMFGALPVGIANGEALLSDTAFAKSIRKYGTRDGLLAVAVPRGVSHRRITEVLELMSVAEMPVVVSAAEVSWDAMPLERMCLTDGLALACRNLGIALREGLAKETDTAKAQRMFEKGCELGDTPSCDAAGKSSDDATDDVLISGYLLGDENGALWGYGKSATSKDSPEFLAELKKAESGDAEAMYRVGTMSALGEKARMDDARSIKWLRKAAEAGHAEAQYALAARYEHGHGIEEDYAEARAYYLKAASSGLRKAQTKLAALYLEAKGGEVDYAQAMRWFQEAADEGDAQAQAGLGRVLLAEDNDERNLYQSFRWYRRAALQGHRESRYRLGVAYLEGLGVPRDKQAAKRWLQRAAEHDHEKARDALGRLSEDEKSSEDARH